MMQIFFNLDFNVNFISGKIISGNKLEEFMKKLLVLVLAFAATLAFTSVFATHGNPCTKYCISNERKCKIVADRQSKSPAQKKQAYADCAIVNQKCNKSCTAKKK